MAKILVVGGAGYIGSHTVRQLVKGQHEVTVLDNFVNGHREALVDPSVKLFEADLGDAEALVQLFSAQQFDAVMHFAAFVNVAESVQEPLKYYENNVAKPLVLLDAMKKAGVKCFVFSSTCATYGIPDVVPISESESQQPINPYGETKLMFEKVLKDCEHAWGLKSVCLRYFNACGADKEALIGEDHDPETHLIPLVLQVVKGIREHISIFGRDYPTEDGTCIRDYIHVDDLADAHIRAVERLVGGGASLNCNLGTGNGFSVKEIIDAVERVTGSEVKKVYGERREGDPPSLVADASLAKSELGWTAQSSDIENIIKTAWAWMQNNNGHFEQ